MIVKVQTAFNNDSLMIYNEDRSVHVMLDEFTALAMAEKLGMRPGQKRYYNATINDAGKLMIDDQAEEQDW